ncbi:MAG: dTDP-4-dehydrorhamnose 3,5-epimerase [Phyllobacteriaceae bacterium]|nr:dTDP-4-dehydrorhamnose 3,5-epimerase [Phyllobacteriaceae bacterium]
MSISIRQTELAGVLEIKAQPHGDDRGSFCEVWNQEAFARHGIDTAFVQDNHSVSRQRGVLRGLHYQLPPFAQARLVRVARGSIFDVAVDIRPGSPSFGKWVGVELSATRWNQLFVPAGYAHGFVTLEPDSEVIYKVSRPYSDLLVVTVSRLAIDLKLDALVRSIDAIDLLAARYPVRLALVGGGPAGDALKSRANAVNARHGREVISLVGEAGDPRSAYAAADIVLGMGSSALRALSIGRPLIVQGEEGFSRVFEPDSAGLFLHQGFYGLDSGREGPEVLAVQIERLLVDKPLRDELGQMGRSIVEENFSLDALSNRLLDIYKTVSRQKAPFIPGEVASVLGKAFQRELQNHQPKRKQQKKLLESLKLRSAASGAWPPANLDMAME